MSNNDYRTAVVKYVDGEYYERGDSRRSHKQANILFTMELCGICDTTHWRLLKKEDNIEYRLSEHIELTLWVMVKLFKLMCKTEAVRFLWKLRRGIERAEKQASRDGCKLDNADKLLVFLLAELGKTVGK